MPYSGGYNPGTEQSRQEKRSTTLGRGTWHLGALAIMAVSAFVLQGLTSNVGAQAQNGTVLAIDVADVSGNSSTSVGTINDCFEAAPDETYTLDVVVLDGVDLVSAGLLLNYQGIVTDRSISDSILNNESPDIGASAAIDEISTELPDSSGSDHVIISNDDAFGSGGASGSGILVRFTMTAPTQPGSFALGLAAALGPDPVLNDSQTRLVPLTHQGATLNVGSQCPAAPTPSETPPPESPSPSESTPASPTPSPSGASPAASGASPAASPQPSASVAPAGGGTGGGGLPLAAWIGIGLGAAAVILGGVLLALSPQLRRRLWPRRG